ncbi:MAG TPA: GNAT family N-acetyltransferase, partial [Thermoleophilaceae bacterium]|nr:GNAT family N-acetyltransferase [Thermoleophilaceae bacterium]
FGTGALELYALRRGGDLAALLPLERRGVGLASPTNPHTPAFGVLASDLDAAEELTRAVLRRRFARLSVEHVEPGQGGAATLAAAAAATRCRTVTRLLARAPYLDTSGDLATYEQSLSSKLLRELRRRRRRLEAEGDVRLDLRDGSAELGASLEEGLRVEAAAWKGAQGTSIRGRADTRGFYAAVARWAAERGSLRLAFLRLGDRPLAFDLSLEEGGVHYLLKTGYDPEARELGPGIMIRHEMIRRAFEQGLWSYELLGRDEPWKLRWTASVRERLAVELFPRSAAGSAAWTWRAGARPLLRRLVRRG